ncbi:MAG: DUF975 family protein [Lachnospiraceae bacterium]|nr:DUF975 family protein [Lachnospiraceae bacterium]
MSEWKRSAIKADGKAAMKRSYWPYVVVSLILAFITGGGAGLNAGSQAADRGDAGSAWADIESIFTDTETDWAIVAATLLAIGAVAVIMGIVSVALRIFAFNPLEVGCRSFFILGRSAKTSVEQVGAGFTGNYWNVVKIQFFRALFTFFWSLLFVIPGIVKSYEYRMIPYILADNPNLSQREAFRLSREMMKGQKWKTFVFDLSFIGWALLGLLTFGILYVFYLHPYYNASCAELYVALRDRTPVLPDAAPHSI